MLRQSCVAAAACNSGGEDVRQPRKSKEGDHDCEDESEVSQRICVAGAACNSGCEDVRPAGLSTVDRADNVLRSVGGGSGGPDKEQSTNSPCAEGDFEFKVVGTEACLGIEFVCALDLQLSLGFGSALRKVMPIHVTANKGISHHEDRCSLDFTPELKGRLISL